LETFPEHSYVIAYSIGCVYIFGKACVLAEVASMIV